MKKYIDTYTCLDGFIWEMWKDIDILGNPSYFAVHPETKEPLLGGQPAPDKESLVKIMER